MTRFKYETQMNERSHPRRLKFSSHSTHLIRGLRIFLSVDAKNKQNNFEPAR